ncbi:hypothetical protein [Aquitalea sp. ASV15]|uniref:hypothetical protein n=1 Tax=Aquitalea sp. ASV15 TaxID=2795104 RepID=UPI0018ED566B|nr:hypothetical protein [Aquitalea sp. ASV15]
MSNTAMKGFFDISSPDIFFQLIQRSIKEFDENKYKSAEKLMFIIMGLNHLREWIAPNYSHKRKAQTAEQHFFNSIYNLPEYKTINSLCNSSKHLSPFSGKPSIIGDVSIDEWSDVDSVVNFDVGPSLSYFVDGQDIQIIIEKVVRFYDENWFHSP